MSYRHTLEAALESLHEIEDLIKGFPGNGNIPAVEIDLTLQKLRNMYELMLMMKKPREEEVAVAVAGEIAAAAGKAAVDSGSATQDIKPEIKPHAKPITTTDTTTVTAAADAAATETKTAREVKTLSDHYKGRPTLHESLHQTFAKEGETLAHAKPVKDLLAGIGINDRFTFIRELFNNDTAAFENTLKALNDASNFNDAYNYMIQHLNWDMDSEAVQQLLDIIRRKFIKGRNE